MHGARSRPSDFTLAPDLALKAVVSPDGRTYTITLRPDVRWESRPPVNGRELVAADVKHSLARAPEVAVRAAPGPGGADRRARPAQRACPPGGFVRPFRSGQAGNRSHVADAQLDRMLEAQRRAISTSSRKTIIGEIQRRVAAQVYYVYTPYPRNVSSWAPRVRNYGPKNSFDRGAQLEVVWLDQA